MKALYSSLLQGARVSRALADAMTTVQTTKQFQHPANWAGFILIGSDVKLSNKVAMMGQVSFSPYVEAMSFYIEAMKTYNSVFQKHLSVKMTDNVSPLFYDF